MGNTFFSNKNKNKQHLLNNTKRKLCLKKSYKTHLGSVLHNRVIVSQTITAAKTEKLPGDERILQAGTQVINVYILFFIV